MRPPRTSMSGATDIRRYARVRCPVSRPLPNRSMRVKRISPLVWLSALAAVAIGLALAHAVPACSFASPGNRTGYAPLTEVTAGTCSGTSLTWLKWAAGLGGCAVAAIVLAIGRARRSTGAGHPPGRRAVLGLAVSAIAVLIALLIPSQPLIPFRSADYGPGILAPMNHLVPLRMIVAAVGALVGIGIAAGGRRRTVRHEDGPRS
jgi:multisubunit Na+/H+ antiporter MnhB subunit